MDPRVSMSYIFEQAKQTIWDYIIGYYSQVRPHSQNNGLSPNETERSFWNNFKIVARFT